jgi:hypothetical protein
MYDEETVLLLAICIACGRNVIDKPENVMCVWVNIETLCPIRPDGTEIKPREPGTSAEPLCRICVPLFVVTRGTLIPVHTLFLRARFDRISLRTQDEGI